MRKMKINLSNGRRRSIEIVKNKIAQKQYYFICCVFHVALIADVNMDKFNILKL
jgi:hypothetical protein